MWSSFKPAQPIDHNFTLRINPESCRKDTVSETPRVEWEFSSNALDRADLEAPDKLRANRESSLNTAEGMTLTSDQPPIPFIVSDHSQIRHNEAVIQCMKAQTKPPGHSNQGIMALSAWGKAGSLRDKDMQLCLDSGADVTLISQEFWRSLRCAPKLKTGIKMNLHALTNNTKIVGYVVIHVFIRSLEGRVLDFEEEAYVIPGMKVPILLGEDFQKNYNISVHCYEGGVHLSLPAGGVSHKISAFNKPQVNKGFEVFKVKTERKEPKGNPGPRTHRSPKDIP